MTYSGAKYGLLEISPKHFIQGEMELTYCFHDVCTMFWRFTCDDETFWVAASKINEPTGDYRWEWIWDRFSEEPIKMSQVEVMKWIEALMKNKEKSET